MPDTTTAPAPATATATEDEQLVARLTDELIATYGDADDVAFFGAQFDAGLAWIGNRVGDGGLGVPPKLQEIVDVRLEAAGRRGSWMRNPMGIGMVGPSIAAHGTEEQRKYLRKIFTAEELWCQLFSEPGAGSDVATLATRAVRDGEEWVVDGQKVWTSLGAQAKYGLLLARTDPDVPKHRGITAFLVDMHSPGIDVRPLRQITGGASFTEIFFTGVRVPDSARVGEAGDGWRVAVTTLMNERVTIGGTVEPRGSGAIGGALKAWRTHGHTDPARRDALMRLWVEAEVLRLGNVRAQQLREVGTPGPEGSVLKLAGALLGQRIANLTVDLNGADGMLVRGYDLVAGEGDERDPGLGFLGSQASTIAGGTTEVMKNILGERILGLPSEPRVDKDVAWRDIPKGV